MMHSMRQEYAIPPLVEEICALSGGSLATGKHLHLDTLS